MALKTVARKCSSTCEARSSSNSRPTRFGARTPTFNLQRAIGNSATARLRTPRVLQRKLTVSRRDDKNEREAEAPVNVVKTGGRTLDHPARDFIESRFGHDFGSVRIHTDARAARSASGLNARAYTIGSNIVFGSDQYNPHTHEGQRLIGHELTHVLQQNTAARKSLGATGHSIQRSPDKTKQTGKSSLDLKTAEAVMYSIIRIINRQELVEPDRWATTTEWFVNYKPLLKDWYAITYGETNAEGGRTRPQGEALQMRLEAAMAATRPLLNLLETKGGNKWRKDLGSFVYPRIVSFEQEAAETQPRKAPAGKQKPVQFGEVPQPVSIEQFFSVVATQETQPVEIARGYGGYSLGSATVGTVFSASQQDDRLLLWSNGQAVFFLRDGQIYSQLARWFSEDILMGAFVIGAQNAAGSAIIAQLGVEIALSLTPWGGVADVVFALEALTRGSWKEAALGLLPGPAIGLASKTKVGRATGRVIGAAASISAQVVKRTIRFIGRGAYKLERKLMRGIWLVGEARPATYTFFDEVAGEWHIVPRETAERFIKCNACVFTPAGKADAIEAAVDDIAEDLSHAAAYTSKGRLLVDRALIKEVVEAYGPWGDHVVEKIIQTWSSAPNAAKLVNDSLEIAKRLSKIKGTRGYQDVIDIFEDLASSSVHTARGAMYELRWAAEHVDELEALGIPVTRGRWVGKGLDVLKKNGEAIELKNFDFTSQFYKDSPGLSVERVVKQVESRLGYKGVTKVMVLFSSEAGTMPAAFRNLLVSALEDLAKKKGIKTTDIGFDFWP